MTLSPDTIQRWSERPSSFLPEWTKTVLEEALTDAPQLKGKCRYEIYVQGSYANETNIRDSTDVDLVVQMQLPFEEQIKDLDPADRQRFWERYGATWYDWPLFRADVLARLRESFFVHEGKKCIDIRHFDSPMRIPADVVPAIEYRDYSSFPAPGIEVYEEGIFFRHQSGRPIINFPKQHLRNGQRKDAETDRLFKPVVRIFKNARDNCDGFDARKAPSYFIECLVFNIDNTMFRHSLPKAYPACVQWLHQRRNELTDLLCQNGLVPLFKGGGDQQWRVESAMELIDALRGQLDT